MAENKLMCCTQWHKTTTEPDLKTLTEQCSAVKLITPCWFLHRVSRKGSEISAGRCEFGQQIRWMERVLSAPSTPGADKTPAAAPGTSDPHRDPSLFSSNTKLRARGHRSPQTQKQIDTISQGKVTERHVLRHTVVCCFVN